MIQASFAQFLAEHCPHMGDQQSQQLATRVAGYLSRTVRSDRLILLGRELEIGKPLAELRRGYEFNPYFTSMLWRAIWTLISGESQDVGAVCRSYNVEPDDVTWVISHMSRAQLQRCKELSTAPWIKHPDHVGLKRAVLSMKPFLGRMVGNKVSFLTHNDPGFTQEDVVSDAMAVGLAAAYRSDNRTTDLVHLRNIAWRSAKNRALSFIKFMTTKRRGRLTLTNTQVSDGKPVKIFRRQNTHAATNDVKTFISTAAASEQEVKVTVFPSFIRNTVSIYGDDSVEVSKRIRYGDLTEKAAGLTELSIDLSNQTPSVQSVCAVLLGDRDPEFDRWLFERRQVTGSDCVNQSRLFADACRFYGVTKKAIKQAMAPVLGMSA